MMKSDFDVSGTGLLTFLAGSLTGVAAAMLLARTPRGGRRIPVSERIREGLERGRVRRAGNVGEPSGS
jgi:hypothetical protein